MHLTTSVVCLGNFKPQSQTMAMSFHYLCGRMRQEQVKLKDVPAWVHGLCKCREAALTIFWPKGSQGFSLTLRSLATILRNILVSFQLGYLKVGLSGLEGVNRERKERKWVRNSCTQTTGQKAEALGFFVFFRFFGVFCLIVFVLFLFFIFFGSAHTSHVFLRL